MIDGGILSRLLVLKGSFYVAIDRKGWFYTGAEAGAYRSRDQGQSWEPFVVVSTASDLPLRVI